MNDFESSGTPLLRGFEICGVRIAVGAPDEEVLDRIVALLPAGIEPCEPEGVDRTYRLVAAGEAGWRIETEGRLGAIFPDLALVIQMMDGYLRGYVASQAPDRVFVHAGAVAHRGRAIVIPGEAFSGKSTLVQALVRAGAVYYSDEYAILDEQGLLHPYARPLSIREPHPQPANRPTAESLGGTSGTEPVPVGLIVATAYQPGASFRPQRQSAAQGVLTLLTHATGADNRPAETMAAARRATDDALVLEGDRGEADAAARELLELADEAFQNGAGPTRTSSVSAPGPGGEEHVVGYEVYGTRVSVTVPDPALLPPVIEQFPYDATRCEGGPYDRRFALEFDDQGGYAVVEQGVVSERLPTLKGALHILGRRLFHCAVDHARNRLVVSAGVVGHEGRAIFLPGPVVTGKSMLVAALVRAGATYYADDWGVVDSEGRVHPFPTSLFLRDGKVSAEDLGGETGQRPIPVGVIATVRYRPEGEWRTQVGTAGEGVMTLIRHAYGLDVPEVGMQAARNAATGAVVLTGERGDADEAAAELLEIAAERAAQPPGRSA